MPNEMAMEFINAFVLGIILVIPVWVIYKKSGLHPALSLFLFVPIIGLLIVYLILALSEWPNAREAK
ncbi:hypothetical protein MNBD_GAMMA13-214 [hydrothermal vent metagenome]|uniref:Uncharacterized protein n=1 Tax=hydrothermal vent metagenome TaxID=652676 RepID=A0A3B0Z4M3_9ZZZZ